MPRLPPGVYKTGHYGVSLLVYAPVGFALVTAGYPALAILGGAGVLWLATFPDVDHRVPGIKHRGITHTLLFALVVGVVCAGLAQAPFYYLDGLGVAPGLTPAVFGFAVGAGGIVGHLAGDVITPAGVKLFYPLSGKSYSLYLTPADSTLWNYGLFLLGVLATAVATIVAFDLPV